MHIKYTKGSIPICKKSLIAPCEKTQLPFFDQLFKTPSQISSLSPILLSFFFNPTLIINSQMPQADLESLVCGDGPKVACETTLIHSQPETDPDLPPESFSIPISGNLEYWLDNINPVYDRDDSTKGTTNPKSHHQQQLQGPTVNSRRFSGSLKATAKAPIIALPNKIQHHSGYMGKSARKPHARTFPKMKTVRVSDPGSPKVSCFGKVLSERENCRRRPPEVEVRDGGCWAVFRCFGRRREAAAEEGGLGSGTRMNVAESERKVASTAAETAPTGEPAGIGGMKRFVSGRRGGDMEVGLEEGHVAWSGSLDRR